MSILSDPSVAKIPHTDPGGSHSRRCCCRATWESEISILVPEYRYDTEDDIDEECPGEYSDTLAYMSESSEYLEVHLYQGVQYEERCDIVECHTRGEILISEQQSREMRPRHDKKSSNPQHQHTQITREYPEYGPDLPVISSAPDLWDHWVEEGDKGSEEYKRNPNQAQVYLVLSCRFCTDKVRKKELVYQMQEYGYVRREKCSERVLYEGTPECGILLSFYIKILSIVAYIEYHSSDQTGGIDGSDPYPTVGKEISRIWESQHRHTTHDQSGTDEFYHLLYFHILYRAKKRCDHLERMESKEKEWHDLNHSESEWLMEEVSREPRGTQIESTTYERTHDHLVDEDEPQEILTACVVSLQEVLGEEVVQTLGESHVGEYSHEWEETDDTIHDTEFHLSEDSG